MEKKIERIVSNKEPIKDGAPIIYTNRAEGVKPEFNIRTDKWEVALDAMSAVSRERVKNRTMKVVKDGTTEPTDTTGSKAAEQ